jgi:hypothetical protein
LKAFFFFPLFDLPTIVNVVLATLPVSPMSHIP